MIGQTIVNVEMGKGRSRVSTVAAGLVLLLLVTGLSEVMAKIPMSVLAGIMVIVAVKTFSWHSIQPATLRQLPVTETLVMLMTVAATVSTGNGAWRGCRGDDDAHSAAYRQRQTCGYIRNSVARPRKIKKPPVSVIAVIMTLEPTAGSRPSFTIVIGIITPINAAISKLSIIAVVITPPSAMSSYSHRNAAHNSAPHEAINQRHAHFAQDQKRQVSRLNIL